jgi:hypothetical protein
LQTRRVSNRYWYPFIAVAAIFWMGRLVEGVDVVMVGASLAMTALAYTLWWMGTFGGADAKGLMVMAWLWPGVPNILAAQTVPVLDTLIQASFLMVALPGLLFLWNAVRGHFALPVMLLGVKMDVAAAQKRHVWPMQSVVNGQLRTRIWHRPAENMDACYAGLRTAGVGRVWTTPKVPFIVPLTVATIVTTQWGNVLLRLLLQA